MRISEDLDPYSEEVMSQRSRRAARRRRYHKYSRKIPTPPTSDFLESAQPEQQDLPVCGCGKAVKYAGAHICEDCFVQLQVRWPGKVTRVRINL